MKSIILLVLLVGSAFAQDLGPDQQKHMLEEMRSMKARLDQLEKNKAAPSTSGLKTTNYQDATTEAKSPSGAASGEDSTSALSADQTKKLMDDLNELKKKQAESQKILDELDNDEKEENQ